MRRGSPHHSNPTTVHHPFQPAGLSSELLLLAARRRVHGAQRFFFFHAQLTIRSATCCGGGAGTRWRSMLKPTGRMPNPLCDEGGGRGGGQQVDALFAAGIPVVTSAGNANGDACQQARAAGGSAAMTAIDASLCIFVSSCCASPGPLFLIVILKRLIVCIMWCVQSPASAPTAIAVASTRSDDARSSFSSAHHHPRRRAPPASLSSCMM